MVSGSYRAPLSGGVYTLLIGSAMATYDTIGVNAPVTFKWTEAETPATPRPTESWERHVNSAGITNWEDHLRSQGIDPQSHHTQQNTEDQWYNPMLECKQGLAFNGDTAPAPQGKMRYMATPSYPSRTLGVFKCKWTIKRGEGPLLKLIFSTIDFECNGLNPKVKSWGTANHVQITDKGNVKTISCGKKQEEGYYTNSDEIDVEIQVNTAGFGKRGSRVQIIYQTVKAKGRPIIRQPNKKPSEVKTTPPGPVGGYTLAPPPPPVQGVNSNNIVPRQALSNLNAGTWDRSAIAPPPVQIHQNQQQNQPPGSVHFIPNNHNNGGFFPPPNTNQYVNYADYHTTTPLPGGNAKVLGTSTEASEITKGGLGIAIGGILVLLVIGGILLAVQKVKMKVEEWRRPKERSPVGTVPNVVTFVNELVDESNKKTISQEPLRSKTSQQ